MSGRRPLTEGVPREILPGSSGQTYVGVPDRTLLLQGVVDLLPKTRGTVVIRRASLPILSRSCSSALSFLPLFLPPSSFSPSHLALITVAARANPSSLRRRRPLNRRRQTTLVLGRPQRPPYLTVRRPNRPLRRPDRAIPSRRLKVRRPRRTFPR